LSLVMAKYVNVFVIMHWSFFLFDQTRTKQETSCR
jgi:hypothetical protein